MKILFVKLCFAVFLIGGISQSVFAQETLKEADKHFNDGNKLFRKGKYSQAKTEFEEAKKAYNIAQDFAEGSEKEYIKEKMEECDKKIRKCDEEEAKKAKSGQNQNSGSETSGNQPSVVRTKENTVIEEQLKFEAGKGKKFVNIDGDFSLPDNLSTWLRFERYGNGVNVIYNENNGVEIRSTRVRIGNKDLIIKQVCYDYRKIEIKGITFASVDENNNVISDYGKPMYSNSKYIRPLITVYVRDTVKNIPLYIVIKNPDGIILKDGSSDKYSSKMFFSASKMGKNEMSLVSLGNENGAVYGKAGNYQYEVYGREDLSEDCMLISNIFTVEALKNQPSDAALGTAGANLSVNQHNDEYERKINPFSLRTSRWNTYHWGISAGYVSRKLKYKDLDGKTDSYGLLTDKKLPGIQAGIHYEGFFMPEICGLGMAAGAYYEYYWQKGDTQSGEGFDDYYASYKEHNVYVPLNLLFRFDFSKKVNIALYGGIGANYGAGNKIEYKDAANDETFEEKKGLYDYEEYGIKHFFMNIEYGGSIRYGRLSVNARFFSPLTDWSEDKFYSEKPVKDMNLSVSFMF